VTVGFLRTLRRERIYNAFFDCSRSGNRRIVFGLCRFVFSCRRAILAASGAAGSVWREKPALQLPANRLGRIQVETDPAGREETGYHRK
jgi:hypothetical protein